ncbi:MAG: hypothetical protein WDN25_04055 [Acetobacteraceae bacterium]
MKNSYPELPVLAFRRTSVAMADVIAHLAGLPVPTEAKRSAYVMFRNESANGAKGINNNYVGAQADSGRWPAAFDARIVGTVAIAENGTGRPRIFVAFRSWTDSVELLIDRVLQRGLYVGGRTHKVITMAVASKRDLARAYHKEWVTGSATAEPGTEAVSSFLSMYDQAVRLFADDAPGGAPRAAPATAPAIPRTVPSEANADISADRLNALSLAGGAFPIART